MSITRFISIMLLFTSAAFAQDADTAANEPTDQAFSSGPAGVYRTRAKATISDPCTGTAFISASPLLGTFELIGDPNTTPGTPQHFKVHDAYFLVEQKTGNIIVSGEGEYVLYKDMGVIPSHRMTLQVSVDGGPVRTFDSGIVPLSSFITNGIDLTLHEKPALCKVSAIITLNTSLVPPSSIVEYTVVKARYSEECIPGCRCPPLIEGPVLGTFDLVPISPRASALAPTRHMLYAVRDVDWLIATSSATGVKGIPVSGKGFYQRTRSATALTGPTQRMELDLQIGPNTGIASRPIHFDSGWVKMGPLTSVGGIQITLPEAEPVCPKAREFEIVAIP